MWLTLKVIICERCGANELIEEEKYYVCAYCGSKFLKETKAEKTPFGTVSFESGTPLSKSLDNLTGGISLDSDIERLLKKCKEDPKNARKYANLILDIDPDNTEAYKYL